MAREALTQRTWDFRGLSACGYFFGFGDFFFDGAKTWSYHHATERMGSLPILRGLGLLIGASSVRGRR